MIKVIFLDYTGTMVMEDEPYTRELLRYFLKHSSFQDPAEVLKVVWGLIKKLEAESAGEHFIRNEEKVNKILDWCEEKAGLSGDRSYILETWKKVRIHAPLYEDVKPFFESCPLPIYVLSNDDLCYLEQSMLEKGLQPAGIISAESARACKPDRRIFEYALQTAGVKPSEALLIGDSMTSDILAARAVGMEAVLIDRKGGAVEEGVRVIRTLKECLNPGFLSF